MLLKNLLEVLSCDKVILEHMWEYLPNRLTGSYVECYCEEIPIQYLNLKVVAVLPENGDTIRIVFKSSVNLLFKKECYPIYDECNKFRNDVIEKLF